MMENQQPIKYPIGGFAPGNYSNICSTCKQEFMGDKLARQCELCAVEMMQSQQPIKQKDLQYFKDEYAKTFGGYGYKNWEELKRFTIDSNQSENFEYFMEFVAARFAKYREQQAKEAAASKWISNAKEPPKSAAWLMAYAPTGRHIAWYSEGIWTDRNGIDIEGVTHWMLIPEKPSPTGKKEGKMEKILINGRLYICSEGTNVKIRALLDKGRSASREEHECGSAYRDYVNFLYKIIDTHNFIFIDGSYEM